MKAGFIMLEASYCRLKDVLLRLKILDMLIGGMGFWLFGYTFLIAGDGSPLNKFVGGWSFVKEQFSKSDSADVFTNEAYWQLHFAFAGNAATIVTGAVLGRVQMPGYLIGTLVITSLVHPIAGHWIWYGGWLDGSDGGGLFHSFGFIDFAGGVVVHAVGGLAALICSVFIGPTPPEYDHSRDSSGHTERRTKKDAYNATIGTHFVFFTEVLFLLSLVSL